jgi:hypothetical protein
MTKRGGRSRAMIGIASGLLTAALWNGSGRAESGTTIPTAGRRIQETVVVTSIDRTTRSMTLQNADGDTRTLGVPPDMKSFDTLKVGDHVDVDYSESIAVALMPPGAKSSMTESAGGERAGNPGVATAGRQITATVEVVSVDEVMNRVTFKGPKGNVRTVTVYDPAVQKKLETLQAGQMVQISYREALVASIKPSASAK